MKLGYLLLLVASVATAQLNHTGKGRITDASGTVLKPRQVRELMASNPLALSLYRDGRNQKTVGNVFIYTGLGLIATDLLVGLNSDVKYPGGLTWAGAGAMLVSVFIKPGYSKTIDESVKRYNQSLKETSQSQGQFYVSAGPAALGIKFVF